MSKVKIHHLIIAAIVIFAAYKLYQHQKNG